MIFQKFCMAWACRCCCICLALERQGLAALGGGEVKEIVGAGVEYLPARDAILTMDRGASEAQIADAMEKELKRSGMFLYNAEVLEAMEHGCTQEPHFLPLSVKKDGTIADGVATAAQLGKLSRLCGPLAQKHCCGNGEGQHRRRSQLPERKQKRMHLLCLCFGLPF